ncbi:MULTISPECIES: signal peptidase I [unclassified Streptomyces]|uniref:signal peptidase I n=1 Tax=unclassified Streptomyces TaxID=2593676 RepID=UPI002E33DD2D|nr:MULTISPECIES: signal peptidase I [unclassified Streptomyces]
MEPVPGRRRLVWAVVLSAAGAALAVLPAVGAYALGADSAVKSYSVPGESMDPAYRRGDTVWCALDDTDGLHVGRGDVVLVSAREWNPDGLPLLKRVVAVGGDRISYRTGDTSLLLDGTPLDEPYLKDRSVPAVVPFDVTVPAGRVFLMGDNRVNSADSSMHLDDEGSGSLPLSAVRGEAVERPTALIVAGGAQVLGLLAFAVGAALGVAAWVVRRRAAARARRAAAPWPVPGA